MNERVLGRYRLIAPIGSGGMGRVFRAEDEHLGGRLVAVKLLHEHRCADPAARSRARKEALTLAQLNHPNIAAVYDFDAHDDVDLIVTEYVEGRTLAEVLADGPLERARLTRIAAQVAAGLDEAHAHGIVHCDLKPSNVMLTADDRVKILDFGVARHLRTGFPGEATRTLTQSGYVAGTLSHMAPEQMRGGPVDERTDVY